MFLVHLAFRNLFRNFRRTAITSVAVIAGVAIQILGWGLVDGLDENILRAASWTSTGDILLRPDGYPDDGMTWPLDQSKPVPPELAGVFQGEVAARTLFQARLVNGAEASKVLGIAYDAVQDPKVFPREHWVIDGAWPTPGATEVVVGDGLARLLQVKKGGVVVVETRTVDGAMNALTYTVTGLVHTDNSQFDNLAVWMERGAASSLLQLDGRVTHIALKLASGEPEDHIASIAVPGWTAHTVREETADLLATNTLRRAAIMIVVFVIMLIAATGIANTTIMAAYERVREIGTLLAMGMRKRQIALMFLVEGGVMGVSAGVIGAALGSLVVLYYQSEGFALPSGAMSAVKELSISEFVYTKFRWTSVLVALVFSATVALLASIFPARFAANLNPADAVRAD